MRCGERARFGSKIALELAPCADTQMLRVGRSESGVLGVGSPMARALLIP